MPYPYLPLLKNSLNLDGQVILVTGGTGSFGKAFVKRVLEQHKPQKIIVFSRDEQKHYKMAAEYQDRRMRFFVGDIRDRSRLMRAFDGVDIVVHAAATKHVHIAEYNPIEAIRTNIEGASHLVDAALERKVKQVVALSTDKAVTPLNLYGATKLCMEKLLVAANSYSGNQETRFDLVRYGNVMGSKGSVIPLFLKQKDEKQLTITEPTMTRFWISMDQAVDLVMLALVEGRGGEVFVPRIPACTIDVLAKAIAPEVPTKIIGIRPGEKMHESLITTDEARNVFIYDSFYVIRPSFSSWTMKDRDDARRAKNDFKFSSEIAEQLSVEQTRTLLKEQGFIP